MAQQVKALAAKVDNLGLIPGMHMVEGERSLQQLVLWPLHLPHGTHTNRQVFSQ